MNCAGIAADVPPAASDDRRLYSQATFYDALHFKLARSVLKIASFANLILQVDFREFKLC